MTMRVAGRAFLVAFLVLLVTVTGRAAGVLVQGTIVDPAGTVIPGATVELLAGGQVKAKTASAADGTFKFADVPIGTHQIRVTLVGFRQSLVTMAIGATPPIPIRIRLQIGSMTETVTVTDASAAVGDDRTSAKAESSAPPPPPPAAPAPVTRDQVQRRIVGEAAGRGGAYGGSVAYPGLIPDTESYAAI